MADRGELELRQLTERLLASRERPKRQWLLQRIGHLWSTPKRFACFHGLAERPHVHALPTPESIAAVASFADDPSFHVRAAMAFALNQIAASNEIALSALTRLLDDPHPIVRSIAGFGLGRRA